MPGGFLAEGAPTCEDVPTLGDTVITSRPEPIRHFVTETLGRTATQQDAIGVYTGEPRTMIMVRGCCGISCAGRTRRPF